MKKLALSIGHGPKLDRGAQNKDGTTELDWNRDLAQLIKIALVDKVDVILINRVIERRMPVVEVNATNADLAIELHCNAFDGQASGTEMIYHLSSTSGKRLAQFLQNEVISVLNLPNRGVKGPQGGGRGSIFLSGTRMPAVIAETMFIDNDKDLKTANDNKTELAQAFARGVIKYLA